VSYITWWKKVSYTAWWKRYAKYAALVFVALVFVAPVYLIFSNMAPVDKATLVLEVVKVLLEVIAFVVVAIVASPLIKSFQKNRRADRALHDLRLEILKHLHGIYQTVASSKDELISVGLTTIADPVTMGDIQKKSYETEIRRISRAHSDLQKIKLEIDPFPDFFTENEKLQKSLDEMDSYLSGLLSEYRSLRYKLETEERAKTTFDKFPQVADFTQDSNESGYSKGFVGSYVTAISYIKGDLLSLKIVVSGSDLATTD
jgi:hypothetical protein